MPDAVSAHIAWRAARIRAVGQAGGHVLEIAATSQGVKRPRIYEVSVRTGGEPEGSADDDDESSDDDARHR